MSEPLDAPFGGAVLRRNPSTAAEVERVLRLPKGFQWTEVQIAFGTDELAEAKITLLITRDQLVELARACASLGTQ